MKQSYGKSASYSGIKARDDLIVSLAENQVLTVKSIRAFILDGAETSNLEIWVGPSYNGAQSLLSLTARNNMVGTDVTIHPNVCFRNQERLVVTIALGDAAACCEYSIVYQVETTDAPGWSSPEIEPCTVFEKIIGRC